MSSETNENTNQQQPTSLEPWPRLKISKGRASYMQERIWLDETFRSYVLQNDSNLHNYNSLLTYKISTGHVSVRRLREAISAVINKHEIFRTSLEYDMKQGLLEQTVNQPQTESYSYQLTHINSDENEKIDELIFNEETSNKDFDLNKGHVFRCHLIKQTSTDDDVLVENDLILLIFHHSAIDEYSRYLFLRELSSAYKTGKLIANNQALRYIDYSQYDHKINTSKLKEFWENLFENYNFDVQLRLPYDRKSSSIGAGASIPFSIDKSLTRQIFRCKEKMNINLFRLFLSCYYIFLYKLTQDEDLCVCGITPNRYRTELNNIIGPLENILSYRFQLNPRQTFNETLRQVEQLCVNVKQNAHFPFQNMVQLYRIAASRSPFPSTSPSIKIPFLQTLLRVDIDEDEWRLDDENNIVLTKRLPPTDGKYKRETNITPIDLTLKVKYNVANRTIDFSFDYATNVFDNTTVELLAERFQRLLKNLFDVSSTFDLHVQPIYELSIILPREERLMEKIKSGENN